MATNNKKRQAVVFTDGSWSAKNPDLIGWGWISESGNHSGSGILNAPELVSGRQVAGELKAAMEAINASIRAGFNSVIVYYDYIGVGAWADGSWKTNKPYTQAYANWIANIRKKGVSIQFVKISGHSGVNGNEAADKLAKSAVLAVA